MKNTLKIILATLALLILFSCGTPYIPADLSKWSGRTAEDLTAEINKKVVYENEGLREYWKSPHETESSYLGDCEDQAILLMDLLYQLGNQVEFVGLKYYKNGETLQHAVIYSNGIYYEPTSGISSVKFKEGVEIFERKSFEEVKRRVEFGF
jgi:hypothetical protein